MAASLLHGALLVEAGDDSGRQPTRCWGGRPERAPSPLRASWYINERGNLLPPEKLSPEAAAALDGWDVVRRNVASGDGHTDEVIRIKRWNKVEALKLLAQRFGLFEERTKLGGRIEIAWMDELPARLAEGRKRVANARQLRRR